MLTVSIRDISDTGPSMKSSTSRASHLRRSSRFPISTNIHNFFCRWGRAKLDLMWLFHLRPLSCQIGGLGDSIDFYQREQVEERHPSFNRKERHFVEGRTHSQHLQWHILWEFEVSATSYGRIVHWVGIATVTTLGFCYQFYGLETLHAFAQHYHIFVHLECSQLLHIGLTKFAGLLRDYDAHNNTILHSKLCRAHLCSANKVLYIYGCSIIAFRSLLAVFPGCCKTFDTRNPSL